MTDKKRRLIVPVLTVALVVSGGLAAATPGLPGMEFLDRLQSAADLGATAPGAESPFESEPSSPGPDWLLNQRAGGKATVSVNDYERALDQARAATTRTIAEAPEVAAAEWNLMGPTNIGGRVVDVAVDPELPGHGLRGDGQRRRVEVDRCRRELGAVVAVRSNPGHGRAGRR